MKLLFVHRSYPPSFEGGDTAMLYDLVGEAVKGGHDVTVAVTTANGVSPNLDIKVGPHEMGGAKVYYFPLKQGGLARRMIHSPELIRFLHQHVHDYDLVHIWSIFATFTRAAAKAAQKAGKPYLVSPQANLSPVSMAKDALAKKLYLRFVEWPVLQQSTGIQTHTEFDRQWALDLGLPAGKMLPVVTYGVRDIAPEVLARLRDPEEDYILYLGRLDPIKALEFFLPCFGPVAQALPQAKLFLVGKGRPEYVARLKGVIAQAGLADKVVFFDHVSEEEKIRLVQNAKALVLPSYTESFGLTVVEAMQNSVPVLVSDGCNVRGHVTRAGCGFVLPHRAEDWSGKMLELLRNKNLQAEMARKGREHFERELTTQVYAKGMLENYRRVIEGLWPPRG